MRDSFVFYRSWAESIDKLPKSQQLETYKAIMEYALNDVETQLTGTASIIYEMAKPNLEANNKRYKNGCTGGRPKDTDSPRKEIDGIELTNLTETQYQKLCGRFGETVTNKAIELFEEWLARGSKAAKEYIGKNHYAHFYSDHWTIREAEKKIGEHQPNWSI